MHGSGGAKSFADIVPLYAPAMLRVAAALVGPAEAEDAVQEASMRAWQAWPTLRNVDAVRPWLLQITLNVCRTWRRGLKGQAQAHLQSLPDDSATEYGQLLVVLEADPGTSNHAGALDLRAAINALPSDLRLVVVLRYYAGLDATEIGSMLSIPAGTVRSRLHRAFLQMRERLQPSGLARTTRSDREGRS
ncbi:MAG TPA: RNA polymerase sigma factor [Ktedonobacterales bacterium]|nr:RNA polymerase sigma factor [Ktedonobacterales bacterium]